MGTVQSRILGIRVQINRHPINLSGMSEFAIQAVIFKVFSLILSEILMSEVSGNK